MQKSAHGVPGKSPRQTFFTVNARSVDLHIEARGDLISGHKEPEKGAEVCYGVLERSSTDTLAKFAYEAFDINSG